MATRLRERGGRVRTGPTLQTPAMATVARQPSIHPLTTETSARHGDTRIARENTREYGPDATTEELDFQPCQSTLLAFPAIKPTRAPTLTVSYGKNLPSSFQPIDRQYLCASPVLFVTTALPLSQCQLRCPSRRGSKSRAASSTCFQRS